MALRTLWNNRFTNPNPAQVQLGGVQAARHARYWFSAVLALLVVLALLAYRPEGGYGAGWSWYVGVLKAVAVAIFLLLFVLGTNWLKQFPAFQGVISAGAAVFATFFAIFSIYSIWKMFWTPSWGGLLFWLFMIFFVIILLAWARTRNVQNSATPLVAFSILLHFAAMGAGSYSDPSFLSGSPYVASTIAIIVVPLGYLFLTLYAQVNRNYGATGPWLCTFLALGVPILLNVLRQRNLISATSDLWSGVVMLYMFAPAWLLYLIFMHSNQLEGWFVGIIGTYIFVFFLVTGFLYLDAEVRENALKALETTGTRAELTRLTPGHAFEVFRDKWIQGIQRLGEFGRNTQQSVERRLQVFNQTQYTGKIDSNARANLGVTLNGFKLDQKDYYDDDLIGIFGTLRAKTLDNPITVNVSCYGHHISDDKESLLKRQYPIFINPNTSKTPIDVAREESVDVDCQFNPKNFVVNGSTSSTAYFYVTSSFDFKTQAYLKRYYMIEDTLRNMRQAGQDPLRQFGITDTNPSAIYTSGPVNIGLDVGTALTGVDPNEVLRPMTLGLTISNLWDGRITSLDSFLLFLPKGLVLKDALTTGMAFKEVQCSDLSLALQEAEQCDDEAFTMYNVSFTNRNDLLPFGGNPEDLTAAERASAAPLSRDIQFFRTYRFILETSDPVTLLGPAPLATRLFRVSAYYTYELEKRLQTQIKSTVASQETAPDENPPALAAGTRVEIPDELITPTTATVRFETAEATTAVVTYFDRPTQKKNVRSAGEAKTQHEVQLTNLQPSTTYFIEVRASNGKSTVELGTDTGLKLSVTTRSPGSTSTSTSDTGGSGASSSSDAGSGGST